MKTTVGGEQEEWSLILCIILVGPTTGLVVRCSDTSDRTSDTVIGVGAYYNCCYTLAHRHLKHSPSDALNKKVENSYKLANFNI